MPKKLDSARIKQIRERFPDYKFPAYLGMEIKDLEWGQAGLVMPFCEQITQGMGYIHGGAIAALCDTSVGIALFTMTEPDEEILTVEFKVNFIAPAKSDIHANAKIVHKGRKTAVGEVEVADGAGELVAKALATYYIYRE